MGPLWRLPTAVKIRFRNNHPAYVGHLEINRVAFQERLFGEADLIVAAGSRLDGISSKEFAFLQPHQELIHVFPDDRALANMAPDMAINAHVGATLDALAGAVDAPHVDRLAWRDHYHGEYDRFAKPGGLTIYGAVDLSAVVVEVQPTGRRGCGYSVRQRHVRTLGASLLSL